MTLPFACTVVGSDRLTGIECGHDRARCSGVGHGVVPECNGVVGNLVESHSAFRVAHDRFPSPSTAMGGFRPCSGAVLAVPGVLDAFVTENTSGGAATVGGVSLAANSLYVCVAGGAPAAVAQAIFSRRGPGCLSKTAIPRVAVYDTQNGGYSPPYPAYSVTYPNGV